MKIAYIEDWRGRTNIRFVPEGYEPIDREVVVEGDSLTALITPPPLSYWIDNTVRPLRNKMLADCDWTQFSDAPISAKDKTDWQVYRQELRDITKTIQYIEDIDEAKIHKFIGR